VTGLVGLLRPSTSRPGRRSRASASSGGWRRPSCSERSRRCADAGAVRYAVEKSFDKHEAGARW